MLPDASWLREAGCVTSPSRNPGWEVPVSRASHAFPPVHISSFSDCFLTSWETPRCSPPCMVWGTLCGPPTDPADDTLLLPASPACHSRSAPWVSCPDTFSGREAASQRSKTSSLHHHARAWGCRVLRANGLEEVALWEELDDMDSSISSDDDDEGDKIAAVYWMLHHAKNVISTFSLSVVVPQSLSHIRLSATPPAAARQASLSFTISQSLFKLMSIESVTPSNHLILCRPLLFLSSIFPSVRVFSNESALRIRWPKYWSFTSVLLMNIQGWFPLRLTGLISLLSKGLSRVFSSTTVRNHQFLSTQPFLLSRSHIHTWLLEKP